VGWWSLSGCWCYVRGDVGVGVEGVCVLCVYACVCVCMCMKAMSHGTSMNESCHTYE